MQWIFQISLTILFFSQTFDAEFINILVPPDEPCLSPLAYYPSDEEYTTLVCECSDDALDLYDPHTNRCYSPYTQGPCSPGYYFILAEGEEVAQCLKNPCFKYNKIPFEGGCYSLGDSYPCKEDNTFLTVELYTSELKCLEPVPRVAGYRYTIYGGIIDAPLKECRKGSRRIYSGKCKRELD